MSCTSCFDNEQKIDEINAENISNIIFQEKVLRLRPLGHAILRLDLLIKTFHY